MTERAPRYTHEELDTILMDIIGYLFEHDVYAWAHDGQLQLRDYPGLYDAPFDTQMIVRRAIGRAHVRAGHGDDRFIVCWRHNAGGQACLGVSPREVAADPDGVCGLTHHQRENQS